jgi:hypothetical protein
MTLPYEKVVKEDLNLGTGTATVTMPGGGTDTGTQINLSTFGLAASDTWDPASVADGDQATTTITVTGAVLGNFVIASFSLDLQGLQLTAYVSAADTVTVVLSNNTGGAVNLSSGTLRVLVFDTF